MTCQIINNSNYDTKQLEGLMQDLYSFSQKRFGFKKPVVLNLKSDSNNTSPLGKTAHYDPSKMEIVIYVDGRHPKDIMRSFSHELVHHNQNECGMFDDDKLSTGQGYAQSDPHLRKMEKEAYLQGNMCFRDWEDGYKSSNPNIFNERRIYKMSTKDWKNKELTSLLNEKFGFSMNLNKLNEASCGSHKRDDEAVEEEIYQEDQTLEEAEETTEIIEEEKPDFLDLDKDGDKEESMKDAAEDAKEMKEEMEDEEEAPETTESDIEKILDSLTVAQLRQILESKQSEEK